MGIDDPKGFIEKRYGKSDTKVTLLVTCVVGEAIVAEVESAVDEAQSSGSWIDKMVSVYCSIYCRKDSYGEYIYTASSGWIAPCNIAK